MCVALFLRRGRAEVAALQRSPAELPGPTRIKRRVARIASSQHVCDRFEATMVAPGIS